MDTLTCKRILESVKEMENSTDWFIVNKEVVELTSSAEVSKSLKLILSEYETFVKAKVESIVD